MKEVVIDGIKYQSLESNEDNTRSKNRCVVVIDRGWIYAGDVKRESGHLILDRAVMVGKFNSIWFSGLLDNPLSDEVTLKKINHLIRIPEHSELFSVEVDDNWGL